MAKRMLTVGCQIPGNFGEFVNFYSERSLLDADFVLFYPSFHRWRVVSDTSKAAAEKARCAIHHWRLEIKAAIDAGITIFVILTDLENAPTPNDDLVNYSVLDYLLDWPIRTNIAVAKGTSMILASGKSLLKDYWAKFGEESQYQFYVKDIEGFDPLVVTRRGNRIVGGLLRNVGGGTLIALPWLNLYREKLCSGIRIPQHDDPEFTWTKEGQEWGRLYVSVLSAVDESLRSPTLAIPTPQWAKSESFKTSNETLLYESLRRVEAKLAELKQQREEIELEVVDAGKIKRLLFEQGHPLEDAVLEAMSILGFKASSYRDSESEFDVVLESPEGRCIGEVEGKDRKAIDINKIRQLETNIHEDLEREEITGPAKAVLFGNAFRLTVPSDRPWEHFTQKCRTAAKRTGTALVRTCDLFEVARKLVDNPDSEFATLCRRAILETEGEVVVFPPVPTTESSI